MLGVSCCIACDVVMGLVPATENKCKNNIFS